ncbi:MAG: hypothetical protein RR806_08550 [Oscillospiraceae bacterium]
MKYNNLKDIIIDHFDYEEILEKVDMLTSYSSLITSALLWQSYYESEQGMYVEAIKNFEIEIKKLKSFIEERVTK